MLAGVFFTLSNFKKLKITLHTLQPSAFPVKAEGYEG